MLFWLSFVVLQSLVNVGESVTIFENCLLYRIQNPDSTKDHDDMVVAGTVSFDSATGLIVSVDEETEAKKEEADVVIDLQGRLVLPGFHDVHLHAVEAGINEDLCLFDDDAPINEWKYYFQECPNGGKVGFSPDLGWIVGAGIGISILQETLANDPNQDYPITVLDRSYPNDPVLILDLLGHGAVANSVAMELVGYDQLTDNPPGGRLDRDPDTGALTGIVLENAQQPLRDAAFPASSTQKQNTAYQSLLVALDRLAQNGITAVSDAGGFWRQAQTEAWARAEDNDMLTVRASNALYIYPNLPLSMQLPDLRARYSNDPSRLSNFNQAKIYVDGILGLATAAMYEPYLSSLELPEGEELGFEYFGDAQTLNAVSTTLVENGFQLHFHVVGDRAAGLALDAIEIAGPLPDGRPHRLTHCYLISSEDRERLRQLNVVADFQLAPSSTSLEYADSVSKSFIGSDRAKELLPATEVYDTGALVTLSSDWDADVLSPLKKISSVLSRPDGRSFSNVPTVLPFLTLNPAKLLQSNTGLIQVGRKADFAIINSNIFEMDPSEIAKARVDMTVFDGEVIFDPLGIAGEPIGVFPKEIGSSARGKSFEVLWIPTLSMLLLSRR